MNPTPTPDLTPVGLVTVFASAVFGVNAALVIGPYVVILLAAILGSGGMIMQRDGDSNTRAFAYFLGAIGFSLMFTVPLAIGLAALWEPLQENWLYAPISAGLAYSTDKWTTRIIPWLQGKVNAFVDMWIASRSNR